MGLIYSSQFYFMFIFFFFLFTAFFLTHLFSVSFWLPDHIYVQAVRQSKTFQREVCFSFSAAEKISVGGSMFSAAIT